MNIQVEDSLQVFIFGQRYLVFRRSLYRAGCVIRIIGIGDIHDLIPIRTVQGVQIDSLREVDGVVLSNLDIGGRVVLIRPVWRNDSDI